VHPIRQWFAIGTFLLSGCGRERNVALDCGAVTDPRAVLARCLGGDLVHGHYIGDLNCYPFAAPERMKGVWQAVLEGSYFDANATVARQPDSRSDAWRNANTWLEASPIPPEARIAMQGGPPRAYAVEFIGRRSICPGIFGHMGVSPHEVVVSRFIRMDPLPFPAETPVGSSDR